jgi:hypothetical protein
MDSVYVHFAPDGRRLGADRFELRLVCPPARTPSGGTPYTVAELAVSTDDAGRLSIPELREWAYGFDPTMTGADGRGDLWGIPKERFSSITDGAGHVLPFKTRYAAYVNFIDFHSINDVFTRPMRFGQGIQDLRHIGDRIVHPASNVEASVNFGNEIGPGSTFRNGEVTLELTGLSVVDGTACAIVGYDAGESQLRMVLPGPGGQVTVANGGSQYKGDIYIDLASRWVRRATLDEHQISESGATDSGPRLLEYTVRHIRIHSVPIGSIPS